MTFKDHGNASSSTSASTSHPFAFTGTPPSVGNDIISQGLIDALANLYQNRHNPLTQSHTTSSYEEASDSVSNTSTLPSTDPSPTGNSRDNRPPVPVPRALLHSVVNTNGGGSHFGTHVPHYALHPISAQQQQQQQEQQHQGMCTGWAGGPSAPGTHNVVTHPIHPFYQEYIPVKRRKVESATIPV